MLDMRVVRPVVLVSALIAWHAAMSASAVYQWEDEKGQVHFSDTVPDKYKRAARRIDTGRADIAPEQVRAAQAQADALKARAAGAPSSSPPASSRQLRASTLPSAAAASCKSRRLRGMAKRVPREPGLLCGLPDQPRSAEGGSLRSVRSGDRESGAQVRPREMIAETGPDGARGPVRTCRRFA